MRQTATPSADQLWALPLREWCLSLPLTSPGSGPISKKTGCNVVRRAVFIIKLCSFTYRLLNHYLRYDFVILIESIFIGQCDRVCIFLQRSYLQSIAHLSLYRAPLAEYAPIIRVQFVQTVLLLDETCAHPQQVAQIILQHWTVGNIIC